MRVSVRYTMPSVAIGNTQVLGRVCLVERDAIIFCCHGLINDNADRK